MDTRLRASWTGVGMHPARAGSVLMARHRRGLIINGCFFSLPSWACIVACYWPPSDSNRAEPPAPVWERRSLPFFTFCPVRDPYVYYRVLGLVKLSLPLWLI